MRTNLTNDIFTLPILPDHTITVDFDTAIVEDPVGREYVSAKRLQPRFKIQFNDVVIKPADVNDLITFYNDKKGENRGFYFEFPWESFVTNTELQQGGSNASTIGLMKRLNSTQYYFTKRYKVGVYYTDKIIWRPTTGYNVYINGTLVPTNDYTFSLSTGILTFDDPVASNAFVTWSGDYYLPVRFVGDLNIEEIVKNEWYRLNDLTLQELLIPGLSIAVNRNLECESIDRTFNPLDSGTDVQTMFKTDISTSWASLENRIQYYQTARGIYTYKANTYKEIEMYYILIFFMVAKGRYRNFRFQDAVYRFDVDSLSISLVVSNEYNPYNLTDLISFYDIASYSLIQTKNTI